MHSPPPVKHWGPNPIPRFSSWRGRDDPEWWLGQLEIEFAARPATMCATAAHKIHIFKEHLKCEPTFDWLDALLQANGAALREREAARAVVVAATTTTTTTTEQDTTATYEQRRAAGAIERARRRRAPSEGRTLLFLGEQYEYITPILNDWDAFTAAFLERFTPPPKEAIYVPLDTRRYPLVHLFTQLLFIVAFLKAVGAEFREGWRNDEMGPFPEWIMQTPTVIPEVPECVMRRLRKQKARELELLAQEADETSQAFGVVNRSRTTRVEVRVLGHAHERTETVTETTTKITLRKIITPEVRTLRNMLNNSKSFENLRQVNTKEGLKSSPVRQRTTSNITHFGRRVSRPAIAAGVVEGGAAHGLRQ